jgi:aminopeptidase
MPVSPGRNTKRKAFIVTELSFNQKLQNYADLTIQMGLNLQPGQRLIINRAPLESAPLVRLLAARAYRAGARLVDVMWSDDALTLARFNHAPRDSFKEFPSWRTDMLAKQVATGDALLSIYAVDPDLLQGQDPELISQVQQAYDRHMAGVREHLMRDRSNWTIITYPVASLAAKVFPASPVDKQVAKMWEAIFKSVRADQPDPLAAWQTQIQQLAERRDYLTGKRYTALKYRAPGTDLTLGLPEGHRWHGGQKETLSGIPFIPNLPTEEVFSLPHKDRVAGVVTSTKPLNLAGVLIENFRLKFEQGKIIEVQAERGQETLQRLIATDEGAARLGEVALVPHSSPISQTGLLFYNTLYDENAASHLAIGRAYRFCLEAGEKMSDEEFAAAGGNTSLTHVDFMIGCRAMDIDGLTADGHPEPLMRQGEWAF